MAELSHALVSGEFTIHRDGNPWLRIRLNENKREVAKGVDKVAVVYRPTLSALVQVVEDFQSEGKLPVEFQAGVRHFWHSWMESKKSTTLTTGNMEELLTRNAFEQEEVRLCVRPSLGVEASTLSVYEPGAGTGRWTRLLQDRFSAVHAFEPFASVSPVTLREGQDTWTNQQSCKPQKYDVLFVAGVCPLKSDYQVRQLVAEAEHAGARHMIFVESVNNAHLLLIDHPCPRLGQKYSAVYRTRSWWQHELVAPERWQLVHQAYMAAPGPNRSQRMVLWFAASPSGTGTGPSADSP